MGTILGCLPPTCEQDDYQVSPLWREGNHATDLSIKTPPLVTPGEDLVVAYPKLYALPESLVSVADDDRSGRA